MFNLVRTFLCILVLCRSVLSFLSGRVPSQYHRTVSISASDTSRLSDDVHLEDLADIEAQSIPLSNSKRVIGGVKERGLLIALVWSAVALTGSPQEAEAKGYKAAQSVYAPQSRSVLYRAPLLGASALLNSLPLRNEIIGQVQAYLESFLQLVNPSKQQKAQLASNSSVLWSNLRTNAQRAAGIFLYNKGDLSIADAIVTRMVSSEVNSELTLGELEQNALNDMTQDVLKLVNASRRANVADSLQQMKCTLRHLHTISTFLIKIDSSSLKSIGPITAETLGIPRLKGRAVVKLTLGKRRLNAEQKTITLIVDGNNYPMTAGSFLELCTRNIYEAAGVKCKDFDLPELDGENITGFKSIVLGDLPGGYREPFSGQIRRIPLETLRSEDNGTRSTITGAARNTAVFTRTRAVYSFATPGAIAMYHPLGDRNGGSASFFAIPPKSKLTREILNKIDKRFAIFAFIVEGLDVLNQLDDDDVVLKTEVEPGNWKLLQIERDPSEEYRTVEIASGYSEA